MNDTGAARTEDIFALLMGIVHGGRLTEARFDAALEPLGLSLPKWLALKQIVDMGEPPALRHLAARLSCGKSNATQLVDRLTADGLVQRVPDPHDRRSILVEVTDKGQQQYRAGMDAVRAIEAELLAGYTCTERQELSGFLARLDTHWR